MIRSIKHHVLVALCGGLILLAGCFPEDTLDWSADGSVGLLRTDEALYLVDGRTGKLTVVQAENVSPWPDISRDGVWIVYSDEAKVATLAEGLSALPPGQVKMIETDAQSLREKVLGSTGTVADLNSVADSTFDRGDSYRAWVVRYLSENADEPLARKLDETVVQEIRQSQLSCYRLVIVPRGDLANKKIVATSALGIFRPRFSPDAKCVAYLASFDQEADQVCLFVASPQQNMPAVHVASRVALGFDWRDDSQALTYLQQEAGDTILGVICEERVRDNDGKLLEETSTDGNGNPLERHHCTGQRRQLVGTLFEPLMKVEYGAGERLFFSSASGRIPTSDLDEPKYLLFCYDFVTGTVADVLPADAPAYIGETVNFFSLSPDGLRVLLPMEKNRFAIYELGTKSLVVPIPEAEQFGEALPVFLPSWKGNDTISCLVAENSHFLASDDEQTHERKEIIVLSATGDYQSTLSADWPDDAIP